MNTQAERLIEGPTSFLKHKMQEELESYRDLYIAALERYHKSKKLLIALHREFSDFAVSISIDCRDLNVSVSGGRAHLNQSFHILRKQGFALSETAARPKVGDTEWTGRFVHKDIPYQVYFRFASTVCVRKQVGTKMEEVPVYATVCTENLENTELPPPANSVVPGTYYDDNPF